MANVVFFSFSEFDRKVVVTIKGRAVNSKYKGLDFKVKDLLKRWDTEDEAVIRQAISKNIKGTSRTIVFVGNKTYKSHWVPEEVEMTLAAGKPVYAIRLKDTKGVKPKFLIDNNITLYGWSEARLQNLATR
ncbi:TIR domain-containing protein [Metallumcola ferriviriculae]|uniref:TIR domain-containing protein n=1 Tax=Metallumcola ferriviriculae TaxID=3039180 RepID=A0AAU0UM39_9FIRM|nr:TIR domain-containing protein [Desulfitibacteraceae bacterium MK1]